MDDLRKIKCEACRGGEPPLGDDEIARFRLQTPAWKSVEREGVKRIERDFRFRNFRQALEFTVKVGELAEAEDHHPEIHLSWGRVVVETWTHKIKGLHRNDFILAAKTDALFETSPHA